MSTSANRGPAHTGGHTGVAVKHSLGSRGWDRQSLQVQQNGVWKPGESGMLRTTQSRRFRRQVLHPTHSLRRARFGETWSGEQHLSCNTDAWCDNFYAISCRAGEHAGSRWYHCQQQNGRQPWANGMSRPIQRRRTRRRVLVPGYLGDRLSPMRMLSGIQNPSKYWTSASKNAFDTHRIASQRWDKYRHSRSQQQRSVGSPLCGHSILMRRQSRNENGGQPGGSGCGSGVHCTIRSRHPRRQVLDPKSVVIQSAIRGVWNGDQNLPNYKTVSRKNTYDMSLDTLQPVQPQTHALDTPDAHRRTTTAQTPVEKAILNRRRNSGQLGGPSHGAITMATIRSCRLYRQVPKPVSRVFSGRLTDSQAGLRNLSAQLVTIRKSHFGRYVLLCRLSRCRRQPISRSYQPEVG
jgi:hypothetical protein